MAELKASIDRNIVDLKPEDFEVKIATDRQGSQRVVGVWYKKGRVVVSEGVKRVVQFMVHNKLWA